MVRLVARVIGVGIETADMLVHRVLSLKHARPTGRSPLCRPHWLTRREQQKTPGERIEARSGNGRVRRGMVQLAWRFLTYQKESALARWYRARTDNALGARVSP